MPRAVYFVYTSTGEYFEKSFAKKTLLKQLIFPLIKTIQIQKKDTQEETNKQT